MAGIGKVALFDLNTRSLKNPRFCMHYIRKQNVGSLRFVRSVNE